MLIEALIQQEKRHLITLNTSEDEPAELMFHLNFAESSTNQS